MGWILEQLDKLVALYLRSRGLAVVGAMDLANTSHTAQALVDYTRRSGFLNNPGNPRRIPKARNRCRFLAQDIKDALAEVEVVR